MGRKDCQYVPGCRAARPEKPSRIREGDRTEFLEEVSKGDTIGAPVIALVPLHNIYKEVKRTSGVVPTPLETPDALPWRLQWVLSWEASSAFRTPSGGVSHDGR